MITFSPFFWSDVEVYISNYKPLELTVPARGDNMCTVKVVCVKSMFEKVVGIHIVGMHAGEIVQGFGFALKFVPPLLFL